METKMSISEDLPSIKTGGDDSDDEGAPVRLHPKEHELMVKELRQRLADSRLPGSIIPRTDPVFLTKFLKTKDYNLDKSLEAVHKYYACVYRNLDFIEGIKPSQCAKALNTRCFSILKHKFNGVSVAVGRIKHWKTKDIELRDFQLGALFLAEQYTGKTEVQEGGVAAIIDLEGLGFEHARKGSIKEIRRTLQVALEGMPLRVKSIHVMNPPMLFWPVYKIGERFMKEKIRNRIHFHYDFESLHKHFDKAFLPRSLGGDMEEDEAEERAVIEEMLKRDIPFEAYWNGQAGRHRFERRLSRKRSSDGFYVHPMIH